MAEDAAFDDYPPAARGDNKRKHEDGDEHAERKSGFASASPGERVRKTGFSGPPSELQHDRKTGFSGPPSDQYERKTGFSGPPAEQHERKSGFSDPDRKTGFSGPLNTDFERKSGFSGPPSGDSERKTGFSGTPGNDYDRKTGFSGPVGSDYEKKTGFSGPPVDQQERKTGFSGSFNSAPSSGLSGLEIAKQRAEQIAARLVAQDAKRSHTDEADDQFGGKYDSGTAGYAQEDHHDRGQMFQEQRYNEGQSGGFYNMQGHLNSKKMDIPNSRVGVVIGKSGETIKQLQLNSGARIQITRDADHNPQALNRQVEIMGTPDQISRAEQMIKDVIAEAEAGGSAFGGPGSFGEPIQIRVPTNKVGLIIGRGGETIKHIQSQSGARVQLVPAAMPDYSHERVITLAGTKQQTDMANDLIREVISENRPRGPPGGYNQQGFRPPGPPQWGQPRAPMQSQDYGYQQQGPYQSQPYGGYGQQPSAGTPQQYPPQSQPYGGYTQQPSSRPPQQHSGQPQSYGYPQHSSVGSAQDFSGQYGGFAQRAPALGQQPQQQTALQGFNPSNQGASPTDGNSGYNQTHGMYSQQGAYGQQGSAVQSPGQLAPAAQGYGQAFNQQQPYGQTVPVQPGFGQTTAPSTGYAQQAYGPQGMSQPSEQNSSTQPGYAMPGPIQQQQGTTQPSYGQQTTQPLGHGQQASSFSHQDGTQSSYGQGAFQPGYPTQGGSQQDASIQSTYAQKELPQVGYGSAQTGYGSGPVQSGYAQVGSTQPGYSSQGPPQSSYGQQQPGFGQASNASVYGTSQQGTAPVIYGTQGSIQPSYNVHGSIPSALQGSYVQPQYVQQGSSVSFSQQGGVQANSSYSEGVPLSQQGSQGPSYGQQPHRPPSGDNPSNGGFDSGVQTAQS